MYITEKMIDVHGPTEDCPKCSTGEGSHSQACRQRLEQIRSDLLNEKLVQEAATAATTPGAPVGAGSSAAAAPKLGGAGSSLPATPMMEQAPGLQGDLEAATGVPPPRKRTEVDDVEMLAVAVDEWDDFASGLNARASKRAGDPLEPQAPVS